MGMYVPTYVKKKWAYGADQTEKVGTFRAERTVKVIELEKMGTFKKGGSFRANRTDKVGALRANKTKKAGLYRDTYPYCFNMGVPPPGVHVVHLVQVGNAQEKVPSEKDSYSKNRGGKKTKLTIGCLYHENIS